MCWIRVIIPGADFGTHFSGTFVLRTTPLSDVEIPISRSDTTLSEWAFILKHIESGVAQKSYDQVQLPLPARSIHSLEWCLKWKNKNKCGRNMNLYVTFIICYYTAGYKLVQQSSIQIKEEKQLGRQWASLTDTCLSHRCTIHSQSSAKIVTMQQKFSQVLCMRCLKCGNMCYDLGKPAI